MPPDTKARQIALMGFRSVGMWIQFRCWELRIASHPINFQVFVPCIYLLVLFSVFTISDLLLWNWFCCCDWLISRPAIIHSVSFQQLKHVWKHNLMHNEMENDIKIFIQIWQTQNSAVFWIWMFLAFAMGLGFTHT